MTKNDLNYGDILEKRDGWTGMMGRHLGQPEKIGKLVGDMQS